MLEAGFICIDHKCSNSVNSVQKSSQQKWVRGDGLSWGRKKGESLKIPGCSYVKMPLSVQNFARAIIGTTLIGTSLHFYQQAMQGLFLFQGTQIYNSWKCHKFNMYVFLAARCISLSFCVYKHRPTALSTSNADHIDQKDNRGMGPAGKNSETGSKYEL